MKYLDFHTHASGCEKYTDDSTVLVVQSLHLLEPLHPRADYATLGVHPMLPGASDVLQRYQAEPQALLQEWQDRIESSPTPIIAIGECGWDHRAPLSLEQQDLLVDFHIVLSQARHLPIVFHIIGGWHHLLRKHRAATTPWCVHGFRGKPQLAQQLADAGIFLSLHPLAPTPPLHDYFLETDESPFTIQDHYQARGADRQEKFNLFSKLFLH